MKKLILSIAILAVMTFAACSDDEKDYTPHYLGCQHCDITDEDGYEVCTGENGNAYVGNADTGIQVAHYYELFCDNIPEDFTNGGGGATYTNCVLCISDENPDGIKICKGSNGNAFTFVGNTATDTGTAYQAYLDANCTTTVEIDPEPTAECVTCAASQNVPAPVEICKGPNGHAFVMNVDMQMDYQTYIDQYEQTAGTTCE